MINRPLQMPIVAIPPFMHRRCTILSIEYYPIRKAIYIYHAYHPFLHRSCTTLTPVTLMVIVMAIVMVAPAQETYDPEPSGHNMLVNKQYLDTLYQGTYAKYIIVRMYMDI